MIRRFLTKLLLGKLLPYDCYWSRRALEAEKRVRELEQEIEYLEIAHEQNPTETCARN